MKRFKWAAILLVLFLLLFGNAAVEPYSVSKTEFLLDTLVTVTAYGKNAEKATESALSRIREIDRDFDAYSETSEIFAINSAPKNTPVPLSDDVFFVLQTALEFSRLSGGAFDITLFPVTKLWGFGSENERVPEDRELYEALKVTGADKLILDPSTQTVTKTEDGVQIDLGAVAKGYASDEAVRVLKENGVRHAYLDLGGNVAVFGGKPQTLLQRLFGAKKQDFSIGIQKPDAPRGELIDVIKLSDGFIVTSGNYERYFEEDGRRFHHILNPKTGMPAETGISAAVVTTQNGMVADILSTALFVTGGELPEPLAPYVDSYFVIDNTQTILQK